MAELTYRDFRADDFDDLWSIATDWSVVRQLGAWKWPASPEQVRMFCKPYAKGDGFVQAICLNDRLVGTIGVTGGEIGYTLHRSAHGQGFGTAAARWAINKAFATNPDLRLIRAGTWSDNAASHALLLKLGFVHRQTRYLPSKARGIPTQCRSYKLYRHQYRLKTQRLTLRELHDGDVPALARIGGHPLVAPNLFAMTVPWPEEQAHSWVQAYKFDGTLGFRLAICLEGKLIGTVMLGQAPGNGPITTAYFIDPSHWGRGYATEAMQVMLASALPRFGIDQLWADHFEDNPASGAVMRKLGFQEIKRGMGTSAARVEPAPVVIYRLKTADLRT